MSCLPWIWLIPGLPLKLLKAGWGKTEEIQRMFHQWLPSTLHRESGRRISPKDIQQTQATSSLEPTKPITVALRTHYPLVPPSTVRWCLPVCWCQVSRETEYRLTVHCWHTPTVQTSQSLLSTVSLHLVLDSSGSNSIDHRLWVDYWKMGTPSSSDLGSVIQLHSRRN